MSNTSLDGIVLRNRDHQVYFQENTGALRRAKYSLEIELWQSSGVLGLQTPAKNNTPLAVRFIEVSGATDGTTYVFYVSSTNDRLICANFNVTSDSQPCPDWLDLPTIAIAPESVQIAVTQLTNKYTAFTGLLLVYEEPSSVTVVMFRFVGANTSFWRDETNTFNAALENDGHAGARVINTCRAMDSNKDSSSTVSAYNMYCFADLDPKSTTDSRVLAYFQFNINISTGNLTVEYSLLSPSARKLGLQADVQ
ncbi:MAG: hypothetical protein Q9168_003414 [Polycauliona sp. 1 TL-2023]